MYHVGLHSLAVLGASFIDVLSSLVGPHEADGFDGRMVTDKIHHYRQRQERIKYVLSRFIGAAASEGTLEQKGNVVKTQEAPHPPSCCPWIIFKVPSGAPASWSILARSMVHPGTRSEGFIR